jgi:glycine cleavage system transcriptional repressor
VTEWIVTVMSADRVGIVAAVSGALHRLGGNITCLSQTVMRGYFTIIMSVELPDNITPEEIKCAVESSGAPDEFVVGVKRYQEVPPVPHKECSERFILTARGQDRPGVIHRISSYLASKGINIEDFYAYSTGDGQFVMILQVAIPKEWDLPQIQLDIEEHGREVGFVAHLQHENIFRATNELDAVSRPRQREP